MYNGNKQTWQEMIWEYNYYHVVHSAKIKTSCWLGPTLALNPLQRTHRLSSPLALPSSSSTSFFILGMRHPYRISVLSSQPVLFVCSYFLKHTARLYKTSQRLGHCDLKSGGWVQGPVEDWAGTKLTTDLSNGAFKGGTTVSFQD